MKNNSLKRSCIIVLLVMLQIYPSWVRAEQHQTGFLVQSKHQVHILYCLARCALHQIIERRKDDELFTTNSKTEVAKVRCLNPVDVRGTVNQTNKK